MEILNVLTTTNPELIKYLLIPIYFLDGLISMLLFTTILKFEATKKQKKLYVLIISIVSIITKTFLSPFLGIIINIITSFFIILKIFKINFLKTIIATIIPALIMTPLESLIIPILVKLLNITIIDVQTIPIYRLLAMGIIYLSAYIIYFFILKFKLYLKLLDNIKGKIRFIFFLNILFAFISLGIELCIVYYYSSVLPLTISILSVISLITYFTISLYNFHNTTQLELATQDIERLKLYNKTLTLLQDTLKTFRHDFGNILQAIGGYATKEDTEGLKIYYNQLLDDYKKVNNLSTLNPDIINEPSVFGILAAKYHKADEFGIKINLEIFMDLTTINMKIYEFTRILGILLDNAVEASKECKKKVINVTIRQELKTLKQILIVENTYRDKNLDINEIFKKEFSTKPGNSGLGLWQITQILKQHNNISLFTTKDENYFTQTLEISKL